MISNYQKNLDRALVLRVIKTLIYFKVRKIKPSLLRIHRFLIDVSGEKKAPSSPLTLSYLWEILSWLGKKEKVESVAGFYNWKGELTSISKVAPRNQEVEKGLKSVEEGKIATRKMKVAVRVAKFLKYLPALRYVGVNGTVALGNPRKDSDIDLFIIADKGRIWTVRFLSLFILEILGVRKKNNKRENRLCLNHFTALPDLKLRYQDLYSALEYSSMITLIDKDNLREKLAEKNRWVENYFLQNNWRAKSALKNYWEEQISGEKRWQGKSSFFGISKIFDGLELLLSKLQIKRIKRKRREEKGGKVYWGEEELVFHPRPKSDYYREKYKTEVKKEQILLGRLLEGI